MTSLLSLAVVIAYIALLFVVAHISGSNSEALTAKKHPRWLVTLAMVGAAITGITFISLPGSVEIDAFSYLQMNLGFIVAYIAIAYWLIPLYYRHNVTSLYEYLDNRFGVVTHTTGAWFFLVAKILGAALRVFVVCLVLQRLLSDALGVPFWITVTLFMAVAWFYTHRGGVSSVIWADLIKTFCMVACVAFSIYFVLRALDLSFVEAYRQGSERGLTQIFFFDDINSSRHFLKLFLSGLFIVIASTGLDQDLMQRILHSDSVRSAQRNMVLSSFIQVGVLVIILILGAFFFLYLEKNGYSGVTADEIWVFVASREDMPMIMSSLLVLGVVASTFSSIGGTLTALTTSFMVDVLHGRKRFEEKLFAKIYHRVHCVMAVLMVLMIFAFDAWSDGCSINLYFKMSSYTFGPLLGMFAFGMFCKRKVNDKWVPVVAILSPLICAPLDYFSEQLLNGYHFGFEILLLNAGLTMLGLFSLSKQ